MGWGEAGWDRMRWDWDDNVLRIRSEVNNEGHGDE